MAERIKKHQAFRTFLFYGTSLFPDRVLETEYRYSDQAGRYLLTRWRVSILKSMSSDSNPNNRYTSEWYDVPGRLPSQVGDPVELTVNDGDLYWEWMDEDS